MAVGESDLAQGWFLEDAGPGLRRLEEAGEADSKPRRRLAAKAPGMA